MSDMPVMRSPLNVVNGDDPPQLKVHGVVLTELPFLRHINVRLQPEDNAAQQKFSRSLGFDVPETPNTFVLHGDYLCAWLGPDEWLVVAPQYAKDSLESALSDFDSGDGFTTCADISSGQTIIRVSGLKAADLLSRGAAYDLHPRNFTPGCCVQTMLARTAVTLLAQSAKEPTIDVIVRRSFADYLWNWLVDAGKEGEFYSA